MTVSCVPIFLSLLLSVAHLTDQNVRALHPPNHPQDDHPEGFDHQGDHCTQDYHQGDGIQQQGKGWGGLGGGTCGERAGAGGAREWGTGDMLRAGWGRGGCCFGVCQHHTPVWEPWVTWECGWVGVWGCDGEHEQEERGSWVTRWGAGDMLSAGWEPGGVLFRCLSAPYTDRQAYCRSSVSFDTSTHRRDHDHTHTTMHSSCFVMQNKGRLGV